jgi:hypothetical protein
VVQPRALTGSGLHVGLTSVFGSFLDTRELQARKAPTVDRTYATRDEVGSVVFGAYLAAANGLPGLRAHGNETFASARITGYKNFLRMHVDREGRLTVHALGIEHAIGDWRPDPDNDDPEASWLVPTSGAVSPSPDREGGDRVTADAARQCARPSRQAMATAEARSLTPSLR